MTTMRRLPFFLLFLSACSPLNASERLGSGIPIILDAWDGQDRTTEHLVATDNTGRGAVRFHAVAKTGQEYNSGLAVSARGEGAPAIGAFLYGEIAKGYSGTAWGANPIGATFSATGNAVGLEVNGVNRSGSEAPTVYGINVVNGGNAPTDAALMIETSLEEPEGKADYGVVIGHPGKPAARKTGLKIGDVDSGEAIRIQSGHRISLSHDGAVYVRYDPVTDQVQVVKHGRIVWSR